MLASSLLVILRAVTSSLLSILRVVTSSLLANLVFDVSSNGEFFMLDDFTKDKLSMLTLL